MDAIMQELPGLRKSTHKVALVPRRRETDYAEGTHPLKAHSKGPQVNPQLAEFFRDGVPEDQAARILMECTTIALKNKLRRGRDFEVAGWNGTTSPNFVLLSRVQEILGKGDLDPDTIMDVIALLSMVRTRLLVLGDAA